MNTTPAARLLSIAAFSAAAGAGDAAAQTTVASDHKRAWSETCGWTNWADAGDPPGSAGARFDLGLRIASGLVWAENLGWIDLGRGLSGGGVHNGAYGNTSGLDFGVNIGPSGELSGYAWSENAGWINFAGGAMAWPPNPARVDAADGRLRGFAWGENIGWINLDSDAPGAFVALILPPSCAADFNADGNLDPDDLGDFINCFFAAPPCPGANFNADGNIDPDDLGDFINAFFAGC